MCGARGRSARALHLRPPGPEGPLRITALASQGPSHFTLVHYRGARTLKILPNIAGTIRFHFPCVPVDVSCWPGRAMREGGDPCPRQTWTPLRLVGDDQGHTEIRNFIQGPQPARRLPAGEHTAGGTHPSSRPTATTYHLPQPKEEPPSDAPPQRYNVTVTSRISQDPERPCLLPAGALEPGPGLASDGHPPLQGECVNERREGSAHARLLPSCRSYNHTASAWRAYFEM